MLGSSHTPFPPHPAVGDGAPHGAEPFILRPVRRSSLWGPHRSLQASGRRRPWGRPRSAFACGAGARAPGRKRPDGAQGERGARDARRWSRDAAWDVRGWHLQSRVAAWDVLRCHLRNGDTMSAGDARRESSLRVTVFGGAGGGAHRVVSLRVTLSGGAHRVGTLSDVCRGCPCGGVAACDVRRWRLPSGNAASNVHR